MNFGIIVAGHGNFGTGILSALNLIAGIPSSCVAIDFNQSMNIELLKERFAQALLTLRDCEIVILTDLFGGSPFNVAMQCALNDCHIRVVYGVNFAMLLELTMRLDSAKTIDELLDGLDAVGRDAIGILTPDALDEIAEVGIDEEDAL